VRRLLALFVAALVGAAAFGWSGASSGVKVGNNEVSASTMRTELAAISTTPALQCYVTALAAASFGPGSGGATVSASGAAAWAGLRVEGLAIEQYVEAHYHYRATAYRLGVATSSLEAELTQGATNDQYTCAGTSAEALAEMPAEMRSSLLGAQAASLYLVSRLKSTIPLTAASLEAYYSAHVSQYDALCVSIALVEPSEVSAFTAAQSGGATLSQLVHRYSIDTSTVPTNGALGCFTPGQSAYATVRADVGTAALDTFPAAPQTVSENGEEYALFVAATKRTTTPFAVASAQVYDDVQSLNAQAAGVVKENILYRAAVAVDPAFGRWGLSTSGPTVYAPATPNDAQVLGQAVLAGTTGATYR
jgi:hypothetical protein